MNFPADGFLVMTGASTMKSATLERALVFFGDAFVANIVGPRSKILEARRVRA